MRGSTRRAGLLTTFSAMVVCLALGCGRVPSVFQSVRRGDVAAVEKWLDGVEVASGGVDVRDSDGNTPLHVAAGLGHAGIVEALLRNRANVGARNAAGETPVDTALKGGRRRVVRLLRLRELYFAAKEGDLAKARSLLATGIEADREVSSDPDCWCRMTPLEAAAASGHREMVSLLLSAGADVNRRNTQSGATPLIWAARSNREGVVRELARHRARVNDKDDWGATALARAAECGSPDLVGLLLQMGGDVNARDRQRKTPLHRAAVGNNRAPVIRLLISKGAFVNARDSSGATPLHQAVYANREGNVRVLLKVNANPDIGDSEGATPLLLAISAGESRIARLLLREGANWELSDASGRTPLDEARRHHMRSVERMLEERGAR